MGPGAQHGGGNDRADTVVVEYVGPPGSDDGQDRFSCSRASAVKVFARRAMLRNTKAISRVEMSHFEFTRRPEQILSIAAVVLSRSLDRSCSGAVTTSAWIWRWASAAASTASRRAAKRADKAARSPSPLGAPRLSRVSAFASSTHRIDWIRFGAVAPGCPLWSIHLDDNLAPLDQEPGQASTITVSSLDSPRPQPTVAISEINQSGVAVRISCRCGGLDLC